MSNWLSAVFERVRPSKQVQVASVVALLLAGAPLSAQFGGPRQAALSPIPFEFMGAWGWGTPRQSCGSLVDSFGRPAVFGDGILDGERIKAVGGNPNLCAWPFGELEKVLNGRGRLWWKTFSSDDAMSPKWACGVGFGRMITGGKMWTQTAGAIEMRVAAPITRKIYTDGRIHPPAGDMYYWGHSIGWMEGDTFVVETTNFTWDTDAYDDQAHMARSHHAKWVERYTLKGKDAMEVQFIVEDPVFLKDTFRWTAQMRRGGDGGGPVSYECDAESEAQAIYSTFKNPYPDDNTLERFFGAPK